MFFIYDHTVLQKEEDDLKDAIIYFHPPATPADTQCGICGQIVGMMLLCKNLMGSYPTMFATQKHKFAVKFLGRYSLGLAGNGTDDLIVSQLDSLYSLFIFYQNSLNQFYMVPSDPSFTEQTLAMYLQFIQHYGNKVTAAFKSLPFIELPQKKGQLIVLQSTHLLQYCAQHYPVYAGCILYRNSVLCTQLDSDLTFRLLLIGSQQQLIDNVQAHKFEKPLPAGVHTIPVYLTPDEHKQFVQNFEYNTNNKGKYSNEKKFKTRDTLTKKEDKEKVTDFTCTNRDVIDDEILDKVTETTKVVSPNQNEIIKKSKRTDIGSSSSNNSTVNTPTEKDRMENKKGISSPFPTMTNDPSEIMKNIRSVAARNKSSAVMKIEQLTGFKGRNMSWSLDSDSQEVTESGEGNINEGTREKDVETGNTHASPEKTKIDENIEQLTIASRKDEVVDTVDACLTKTLESEDEQTSRSDKAVEPVNLQTTGNDTAVDTKSTLLSTPDMSVNSTCSTPVGGNANEDNLMNNNLNRPVSCEENLVEPGTDSTDSKHDHGQIEASTKEESLNMDIANMSSQENVADTIHTSVTSVTENKMSESTSIEQTDNMPQNQNVTSNKWTSPSDKLSISSNQNIDVKSLQENLDNKLAATNKSPTDKCSLDLRVANDQSVEAENNNSLPASEVNSSFSIISNQEDSLPVSDLPSMEEVTPPDAPDCTLISSSHIGIASELDSKFQDIEVSSCKIPLNVSDNENKSNFDTKIEATSSEDSNDYELKIAGNIKKRQKCDINNLDIEKAVQSGEARRKQPVESPSSDKVGKQTQLMEKELEFRSQLTAASSLELSLNEQNKDLTLGPSENDKSNSGMTSKDTSWTDFMKYEEESNVPADLYVQGNSEMLVLLLMDKTSSDSYQLLEDMWRNILPQLADLEAKLQMCLQRPPVKKPGEVLSYNYLHFNNHKKCLSGKIAISEHSMVPMSDDESYFCETAVKLHELYSKNPHLKEVTLRNNRSVVYGHHMMSQETYFQKVLSRTGSDAPSEKDATLLIDRKAKEKLQKDQGITLV